MTFFVYLNNLPEGQGHTEFPNLKLSVRPQRGCAVLFPNLLPSGEVDVRTIHQACPVEGRLKKYGMNIWICNSSLGYMQSVSQQKQPKSLIEYDSRNSMLNEAERLTNEYEVNGSSISWVTTGNKYIDAIVAAPFMVTSDDEGEEGEDDSVGKSSAQATANVSPVRSSVGGSPNKRQRTEIVSPHTGRKGKRGTPRVYEQIFYGRVVKYAPPSSDTENDELFHILWDDGDSQDYDAEELKAGVALYESLHGSDIPSKDEEVAAASASNEKGKEEEGKEEEGKEDTVEKEQCTEAEKVQFS